MPIWPKMLNLDKGEEMVKHTLTNFATQMNEGLAVLHSFVRLYSRRKRKLEGLHVSFLRISQLNGMHDPYWGSANAHHNKMCRVCRTVGHVCKRSKRRKKLAAVRVGEASNPGPLTRDVRRRIFRKVDNHATDSCST